MTDFSDFLSSLKSRLTPAENTGARDTGARDLNPSPPGDAGGDAPDAKLRIAAVALVLRRRLSEAELLVIKRSV
jgi:hypothetical protein